MSERTCPVTSEAVDELGENCTLCGKPAMAHPSEKRGRSDDEELAALDAENDMYPAENPYDPLTGWK